MAEDAPLADLRVVEGASGLAASYAGFLLAALGAEVVKVEPPGAARILPGAAVMERGKRSATLGVAAAVFARRRGAPGQEVRVSGLRAAFALNSGTYVTGRETRGSLSQFGDPRGQMPTYSLFRTVDGWLFIGALTPAFLVKLMTVLERVDLLADPRLQGSPLAFGVPEIKDFVRRELDPILATRTTAEWLGILGEADIPCGPVRTREQALADPAARALALVVPLEDPGLGPTWQPGAPALFSDTPAPRPRPA